MRASKTARAKKDEAAASLRQARKELIEAVAAVPTDKQNTPFLGAWSVNDLVAHLAGWDHANLAAMHAILAGRVPDFYARYDTDWRTFNAELVSTYKRETLAETMTVAQASHSALIREIARLPAEEIAADRGVRSPQGRRVTILMLLAAEAQDERVHCAQVGQFKAKDYEAAR